MKLLKLTWRTRYFLFLDAFRATVAKINRKLCNYTEQDMQNVLQAIQNDSKIRVDGAKRRVSRASV